MAEIEIPADKEAELRRLRAYFPYRIHFVANRGDEWQVGAVKNRRYPNKLTREGWAVHIVTNA